MSEFRNRRKGGDRRQAGPIHHFPILDAEGNFIENDRRCEDDRRVDPTTTLQFIKVSDFIARLDEMKATDTLG